MNKPIVGEKYGTLRVLSGKNGSWETQCEECSKIIYRRANELMGTTSTKQKRCSCQIVVKNKWSIGDMIRGLKVIGTPEHGKWLMECRCGKHIRRSASSEVDGCGCGRMKYELGQIVHGRRVVKLVTKKHSTLTVECISCGATAKINPSLKASKCRWCGDWDETRFGDRGYIYAIVCPYTAEAKYVGATGDKSYRRVIGHFRERNSTNDRHKPLYQWLQMLANEGAMPGCILLEEVTGQSVHQREIFWIGKLRSEGCSLFNLEHNKEVLK